MPARAANQKLKEDYHAQVHVLCRARGLRPSGRLR